MPLAVHQNLSQILNINVLCQILAADSQCRNAALSCKPVTLQNPEGLWHSLENGAYTHMCQVCVNHSSINNDYPLVSHVHHFIYTKLLHSL